MMMEEAIPPLPIPDPTALTTAQIDRAVSARTELVNAQLATVRQRLDDMDKANEILSANVTRVPTDVDKQVGALKELHGVRFDAVDKQFETLERQRIREATDTKEALAAALAAAKELVSVQNASNSLAILKSESSTVETINKLSELVDVNIKSLGRELADIKARVIHQESIRVGGSDERDDRRQNYMALFGAVGAIVGIIGIILAVVAFTKGA